ncbi:TolC family protein [Pasteurella canis]|uniref:TolC family protein n=1 Tax=Pasteurella canis TaxID=753 RepID=UPI001D120238|nr:TolC family protein [Pasteurella canis]UDW83043.1 TolC family protein [Pasteurella canis]UEA16144.1 TolC family protein [Pasteurella canis]
MQKTLITLILSVLLTSCQNTNIDLPSQITLPAKYTQETIHSGQQAIQQWWESWRDPQLTDLIQRGLAHNHDIAIAQSKLTEAQAIAQLARASLFPKLAATGNLGKAHIDIEQFNMRPQNSMGGVSMAWEPDIFGQKQSDSDAAQAAVAASQQQVYGSQMLITSEIAHYYLKALHTVKQQLLLQRTLDTLQDLQRYLKGRFNAGQVTAYELDEVTSQLQAIMAKNATLQAQLEAYQRAIAVLIGAVPQTFSLNLAKMRKVDVLAHLPPPPQGGRPSDLLAQRPDIQAQAENVKIWAAKLASAKADLLPRFNIQFLWQTGHIELDSNLPHLNTWQNLISAGIQVPIFTAGRIKANIKAADARLQQALLQYDQTLLKALAEVDNSYQLQFALNRQSYLLTQALTAKQRQSADSQKLFQYAEQTFDRTLQTKLDQLLLEEKVLDNQLAKATNLISLYKAIGLGWQAQ